eukprot:6887244-Alexandrium_andersonii.AAC.1
MRHEHADTHQPEQVGRERHEDGPVRDCPEEIVGEQELPEGAGALEVERAARQGGRGAPPRANHVAM